MSSNEWWWAAHKGSRPHLGVRRRYTQAAKPSEDGVSSSQPPELEDDESSQAKTAKTTGMLVSQDHHVIIPRTVWMLLLLLGMLLGLASSGMLSLKQLLVPVLVVLSLVQVPVQTLERCWRELVLLVVVLELVLARWFPLWHLEVLELVLVLVLVLVLELLLTLLRVVILWCARIHGRDGRLMKWEPHEWVLDSGAWNHHTANLGLLLQGGDFQFQATDNDDAPSSGVDSQLVRVQGRGSVRTDCFDFAGIDYYVGAGDTRNVVSVSQLARDHGLVTVFEPTSCRVKDKKTGQIVGKGRLRNGVYIMDSLRIVGQHIRDGGASRGDRHDGADGGGGGNGDGDSIAEGRGGGGRRDGRGGGGTGARNQEESGGSSGAAEGDVNEINEEVEEDDEKEFEEINENDEDDVKEIGEINGKEEKEDDDKRGGQNFGQLLSPSHTGLFGLSRLLDWIWYWIVTGLWIIVDWIWWIVSILCIAACILQLYTGWGAGTTISAVDLVAGFWVLFLFIKTSENTWGPYLQELSHQEHNKRLFGLSRFDAPTDPTGHRRRHLLPARAFPTSTTNAACRPEYFFMDSGASFHTTWNESILFHYPQHLENHTKPPTMSLGGIAAGSIAVKRSGYLNGNKIMLDGVLLALEAQANLVSVGQLSIYYGVQVEMDDQGVVIKKKRGGVQIGRGRMLNNLYVLEYFLPGGLFAQGHTPHP